MVNIDRNKIALMNGLVVFMFVWFLRLVKRLIFHSQNYSKKTRKLLENQII